MKNLVTNGFKNYRVVALVAKGNFIVSEMKANDSFFLSPDPDLDTVTTVLKELEVANLEATTGDRMKIAIVADKKAAVVDILQNLGVYVNLMAKGSRTVAMLSGFSVRKISEQRILLPVSAPQAKRRSMVGQIAARIASQRAADGFVWYITDDNTKPWHQWEQVTGKGAKITFDGRQAGKTYYICVELLGSREQRILSPVATMVA